jgi:DNA replication protein DnaC
VLITSSAPPLPDDLEALLRTLRLPYIRAAAPEVLATAKAQRWEPAEVLRALLAEERRGRDRSAVAIRRAAAGFPTGKTFAAWRDGDLLDPRTDPGRAAHPGVGTPP